MYGATGAVGKRVAKYLAQNAPDELRWSLGGRTASSLLEIKEGLAEFTSQERVDRVGIVVGDTDCADEVVKTTRVLAMLAGPYNLLGEPFVRACIDHGTDYLDITGELNFMHRIISKYAEQAKQKGVAIVFSCGFDCAPMDLGAFYLVEQVKKKYNVGVKEITTCFTVKGKGGSVGKGTLASLLGTINDADGFGLYSLQKDLLDPEKHTEPLPDNRGVVEVPELGAYGALFPLSPANVRIVRRSASLFANTPGSSPSSIGGSSAYCEGRFKYGEVLAVPSKKMAYQVNFVLGGGIVVARQLLRIPGVQKGLVNLVMERGSGPAPGGENSSVQLTIIGKTDELEPRTVTAKIECVDPGYGDTARIYSEAVMLVAMKRDSLPLHSFGGGILTPATALGNALVAALGTDEIPWIQIVD